ADPELAAALRSACLERGLLVELGGRHDTVLRLLPPLVMTDAEADTVLDRLDDALAAVGPRPVASTAPPSDPVAEPLAAPLSGGAQGADDLAPLVRVALDAMTSGTARRGGPITRGGPEAATEMVRELLDGQSLLAEEGTGAAAALAELA